MVLAPLPEVEVGYSHMYVLGIMIRRKWHFGYHTLLYLTVFVCWATYEPLWLCSHSNNIAGYLDQLKTHLCDKL